MPHALDDRPLLVRLNARIQKYQGCTTKPLGTDASLHQQSVEEINRLTAENQALRKGLSGMLFAFDDGVGRNWSAELLDHARAICPATEFKT